MFRTPLKGRQWKNVTLKAKLVHGTSKAIECNHCLKVFAGNAGRVRDHLAKCPSTPEPDRAWAREYNADLQAKALHKASVLNLLDKIDGDEDTEFQQTLTGVFAGAKSATGKCNEAVATWVAETLAAFSAVEKPSFINMLATIRKYAPPDWRPPSRKDVGGPLLDELHRKVKLKVDAVLDSLDGLCSLTFVSDGHSDKTRCPVVNYLACSTKGAHHLGIDDLSGEAKDNKAQAKRMVERMKATGKEKSFVLVAVLDGALRSCFPELEKEMPWLTAVWCACHIYPVFIFQGLLHEGG
jgi:hypothetical protein